MYLKVTPRGAPPLDRCCALSPAEDGGGSEGGPIKTSVRWRWSEWVEEEEASVLPERSYPAAAPPGPGPVPPQSREESHLAGPQDGERVGGGWRVEGGGWVWVVIITWPLIQNTERDPPAGRLCAKPIPEQIAGRQHLTVGGRRRRVGGGGGGWEEVVVQGGGGGGGHPPGGWSTVTERTRAGLDGGQAGWPRHSYSFTLLWMIFDTNATSGSGLLSLWPVGVVVVVVVLVVLVLVVQPQQLTWVSPIPSGRLGGWEPGDREMGEREGGWEWEEMVEVVEVVVVVVGGGGLGVVVLVVEALIVAVVEEEEEVVVVMVVVAAMILAAGRLERRGSRALPAMAVRIMSGIVEDLVASGSRVAWSLAQQTLKRWYQRGVTVPCRQLLDAWLRVGGCYQLVNTQPCFHRRGTGTHAGRQAGRQGRQAGSQAGRQAGSRGGGGTDGQTDGRRGHMTEGRLCQIRLLDDRDLELLVQPKLLSRELLDLVSSHFNLKEKEYFGLSFIDDT
ncbi:hypothetical protein CRUP_026534 [Coryphaenoides rupestris]|nr:hypothetical protein CRUP_026534 [Coryphaenoides rupestris]